MRSDTGGIKVKEPCPFGHKGSIERGSDGI